MGLLNDLFVKYGTDKGDPPLGWGYTPYYEEAMGARRFDVKKVLEIGICGYRDIPGNVVGASLFAWREYFPNAEIFGVDNDNRFVFNDQTRIHTVCADAYNHDQMVDVMELFGSEFDMIVDDAVHEPGHQIKLLNFLAPYLNRDGRYFIEEICPYKIAGSDLAYYTDRLTYDWRLFCTNHTHKPEVLGLAVK